MPDMHASFLPRLVDHLATRDPFAMSLLVFQPPTDLPSLLVWIVNFALTMLSP